MTSGNQTYRNAHKKRSGASGEHPASRSAPRCPLRGVPGRRVLSIRACLRPGNALTPRRKCSNRAASNFNSRSPAHGFDVMFPISSAMQCGDEKNTQKTAVCRARSTHHTAAKLGQPIKKEKNRGITLYPEQERRRKREKHSSLGAGNHRCSCSSSRYRI